MNDNKRTYKLLVLLGIIAFVIILLGTSELNRKEAEGHAALNAALLDSINVPEIKSQVKEYEICVVAEVTQGVNDMGDYTVSGEKLFGDTEEDIKMRESFKANGFLPETVSYNQYHVKVDQYIYDKTGEYKEEIDVIYGLAYQEIGIQAEAGMKLILFLTPSDSLDGKYIASICWAYHVNDNGTIVPTIDNEKHKEYKGKKIEKYIEKISKIYEKYGEDK
ncbi:MAG: hypothetical protein OSJ52_07695 [Lachnospiraceae bacterium]|nr:hypothetical protein [Lachnospiraceae bacterium]